MDVVLDDDAAAVVRLMDDEVVRRLKDDSFAVAGEPGHQVGAASVRQRQFRDHRAAQGAQIAAGAACDIQCGGMPRARPGEIDKPHRRQRFGRQGACRGLERGAGRAVDRARLRRHFQNKSCWLLLVLSHNHQ